MPWKPPAAPEYVPDEYPKMLTEKDDKGAIHPVVYPPGHEKNGLPVIFENEDEEKAFGKPRPKARSKDD